MEKVINNGGSTEHWNSAIVLTHLKELINANDIRYRESFAAAKDAVLIAFAAQEKSTQAAFVAAEKAVALSEANAERWRADSGEWRTQMTDREKDFATKAEVSSVKERLDRRDGKNSVADPQIIDLINEVKNLQNSFLTNTGMGKGQQNMVAWVVAGIATLISIGTFVNSLIK